MLGGKAFDGDDLFDDGSRKARLLAAAAARAPLDHVHGEALSLAQRIALAKFDGNEWIAVAFDKAVVQLPDSTLGAIGQLENPTECCHDAFTSRSRQGVAAGLARFR